MDVKGIKLNNKENENQCNHCGIVIQTSTELVKHVNDHHEQFTCIRCQYISFGEIDMKNHARVKHPTNP